MTFSISAIRRPLAYAAVTAALFSVVACSGTDEQAVPPAATSSAPASEPAATPSESASASASESSSPSESASSAAPSGDEVNEALLAAGALGAEEVSKGTVVSIESERQGWEVHVVTANGDERQLMTNADGTELVSGPTDDRPDAEDRAENQAFAKVGTDYKDAITAIEKEVDGGEIRELSLDEDNRQLVWEADVTVGTEQRSVHVDADNGRVISNQLDD